MQVSWCFSINFNITFLLYRFFGFFISFSTIISLSLFPNLFFECAFFFCFFCFILLIYLYFGLILCLLLLLCKVRDINCKSRGIASAKNRPTLLLCTDKGLKIKELVICRVLINLIPLIWTFDCKLYQYPKFFSWLANKLFHLHWMVKN